jgi:hypothetical protein
MALSWRSKKQLTYLSIVLGVILIFVYRSFIAPVLSVAPTCFDGKQNGNEQGLDCGGPCQKVCPFQSNALLLRWARVFKVTPSIYNAMAYVDNQNPGSAIRKIAYEFRVYDDRGIFITSRTGESFIGPVGRFVIFEPSLSVGNRVPAKTLFKFIEAPVWEKIDRRFETFPLSVRDKKISNPESAPKLEATVANDSIYDLTNIPVIAILYDKDGNALGASRTFLDKLPKNSTEPVYFTWPEGFTTTILSTDIFPEINPFSINL